MKKDVIIQFAADKDLNTIKPYVIGGGQLGGGTHGFKPEIEEEGTGSQPVSKGGSGSKTPTFG